MCCLAVPGLGLLYSNQPLPLRAWAIINHHHNARLSIWFFAVSPALWLMATLTQDASSPCGSRCALKVCEQPFLRLRKASFHLNKSKQNQKIEIYWKWDFFFKKNHACQAFCVCPNWTALLFFLALAISWSTSLYLLSHWPGLCVPAHATELRRTLGRSPGDCTECTSSPRWTPAKCLLGRLPVPLIVGIFRMWGRGEGLGSTEVVQLHHHLKIFLCHQIFCWKLQQVSLVGAAPEQPSPVFCYEFCDRFQL